MTEFEVLHGEIRGIRDVVGDIRDRVVSMETTIEELKAKSHGPGECDLVREIRTLIAVWDDRAGRRMRNMRLLTGFTTVAATAVGLFEAGSRLRWW